MTLDIPTVFEDGIDEFLSVKALVLAGVFFVVSLGSSVLGGSLQLALADLLAEREGGAMAAETLREQAQFGFDIGLGPVVVAFVSLLLAAEVVRVVAVRALADESTDQIETRHYAENLVPVVANRILAVVILAIVFTVLAAVLAIPSVLFFPLALAAIPVFLYVALPLYLAPVAVVVDEIGPLDAIERVWDYGNGNRIRLFVVALGVLVCQYVITLPTFAFMDFQALTEPGTAAASQSPLAIVVSSALGGVSVVFGIAIVVATYKNLDAGSGSEPTTDDPVDGHGRTDARTEF